MGKVRIIGNTMKPYTSQVIVDGYDISGMVQAVDLHIDVTSEPSFVTLRLAPEVIELEGDFDVVAHRETMLRHKL